MDDAGHKALGIELFNFTWTLLDKKERSLEEDETMVHAAHASRFHWSKVGKPVNFARGDWQVSRVYSVLGRAEPALHHAQRVLAVCEEHGIGDFDLAFAHEALARAYAVFGHRTKATEHLARAKELTAAVKEADDREILEKDLATIVLPKN
jgi:hypothetical protein